MLDSQGKPSKLKSKQGKPGRTIKESDIQKAILEYLRKVKSYTVWRSYVGPVIHRTGVFTKNQEMAGFPDITGFLKFTPTQMFCIEVKTAKGVVSPDQKRWHKLLTSHGVPVLVARNLHDVVTWLDRIEDYGRDPSLTT